MRSTHCKPIAFAILLLLFLAACGTPSSPAVAQTPTPTLAHYTATASDPAGTTMGTSWDLTFVFDHRSSSITTWMYNFPKGFACYVGGYFQVQDQSLTKTLTTPTPVVNGLFTLSATAEDDTLTVKGTLSAESKQAAGTWSLVGPLDQPYHDNCSGNWMGSSV